MEVLTQMRHLPRKRRLRKHLSPGRRATWLWSYGKALHVAADHGTPFRKRCLDIFAVDPRGAIHSFGSNVDRTILYMTVAHSVQRLIIGQNAAR